MSDSPSPPPHLPIRPSRLCGCGLGCFLVFTREVWTVWSIHESYSSSFYLHCMACMNFSANILCTVQSTNFPPESRIDCNHGPLGLQSIYELSPTEIWTVRSILDFSPKPTALYDPYIAIYLNSCKFRNNSIRSRRWTSCNTPRNV